jgi:transposase InsO family protein
MIGRIKETVLFIRWMNREYITSMVVRVATKNRTVPFCRVLPFFDEYGIRILRLLSDNGAEYCGRPESHPYELFLHLNDIEHTRIKIRHPQTNGSVERLNQTVQEEFYKVAFRKKLYRTIEEIQADLDEFMAWYNNERTNQGRYCQGRTPVQTLIDGLALYNEFVYDNLEGKEAA